MSFLCGTLSEQHNVTGIAHQKGGGAIGGGGQKGVFRWQESQRKFAQAQARIQWLSVEIDTAGSAQADFPRKTGQIAQTLGDAVDALQSDQCLRFGTGPDGTAGHCILQLN